MRPVLLFTACLLVAAEPAHQRDFTFEYNATVKDIPAGTQKLELWIPVPHDDPYQRILDVHVDTPYPHQILTGDQGNRLLHLTIEQPKESSVPVTLTFHAVRLERIQPIVLVKNAVAHDDDLSRWLKPDRLVPIDGQIRTWAREVVDAVHAQTDLKMARAIYNHVVSTVKYDKTGKGWGRGDIYYACDARRGNCTDFHAIFIGYVRAMGIPARFAIGFPLPAERGAGKIAGYHCWAEFYAKGIGWIPVDASEAAKNPAKREYFFGAHDENRVELSKGRDVVLTPKQQGDPLNYFVYPYVEIDGKPYANLETGYSYRDLAPVAQR
ncbi:MAG TPA: transglutaminase-like domain-containing protein [Bryobacteraceae bacterium]|jgi:transglutaminase-like putative cysteine protease|nr:transglutaminase-like domain-containing protein [Bryobacteraceae bacterium]